MDFCRKQVKADCEELLGRFQKTDSVRLQIFTDIWKEMNFSQIFYGTTRFEQRSFTRLILDQACVFFLPPFSFQIRVGGLYLLHALIHSQLAEPPEAIRVSLKDWSHVQKFEKDAMDAQHLDVIYVFRKMMSDKAFLFTAMQKQLMFQKKRKVERSVLCEDFMERASRPQELINIELLEELSNIHELYDKLKTCVSADPSFVALTRKDLVPELRETVVSFYQWQQNRDGGEGKEQKDDCGEGTSQEECSQRADRLASIKSRAYGEATEASKSRRHRQVELDLTSSESGPSNASRYSKITKLSLKARTVERLNITVDARKEEEREATKIHQMSAVDFAPELKPKRSTKFKW